MAFKHKNWLLPLFISTSVLMVSGCNDDDDDNNDMSTLFVANDLGGDLGKINKYTFDKDSGPGNVQQAINLSLAEGIAKDAGHSLYQAGINGSGQGTLRVACSPEANAGYPMQDISRMLTTALDSPKGIAIAQKAGYAIAAETGDAQNAVSLVSLSAAGTAVPVFVIPRANIGDSGAWDVAYDEDSDKLFVAATNGNVAYYANFMARIRTGDSQPTHIFRAANALASSNMHGIVYDAAADRLVVSDVADPASADDGSIYVFGSASSLQGAVTPDRTLRGTDTHLGNPVDLQMIGHDLLVAEKANAGGRLLLYRDIAAGVEGNVAPDGDFLLSAPESLLVDEQMHDWHADLSDLSGETISRLYVTSNAGGAGKQIFAVPRDLNNIGRSFTPVLNGQFVESLSLDANGNAVVSMDDAGSPSTGGLSFVNRLASRANGGALNGSIDRQLIGANTQLVAPKGIDIAGERGLVLVADLNGAAPGAIKVFSLCGTGNSKPMFMTMLQGDQRPWDLDYDPDHDRLYVAATNGTILVFDDYLMSKPAVATRIIDPDDQSGFSASNIHGIVHDVKHDRLIVSDVGDAGVANDGRIYVIENASSAEGVTELRLELAGAQTLLGNPVDLAFDGRNLYVAEKSNNQLQKIENIYDLNGLQNRAPDKASPFTAPESVVLSPDFLP
ncbi:MAG: hypothetical protein R3F02_02995 [Thiolinea sp.]